MTLADNDKVISNDKQLYKTFSFFFQETLGVSDSFNMCKYSYSDQINNAIGKYENHPSLKNKRNCNHNTNFSFLQL